MNKPWRSALGLSLCLSAAVWAQTPGVDSPPEPGPAVAITVPPFEEFRLSNGVRVVLAERHDVPLVSAMLRVGVGRVADPADRAGLAGITATLLTKGAKRDGKIQDATQIARAAEALGGLLLVSAGWDSALLGLTVSSPKLDAAVSLLADLLRAPTFPAAELERTRAQALDALKLSLSDPLLVAQKVARRVYWGASAYGASSTAQTLARIHRSDVLALHRRWVRPDTTTLILAGDLNLAQARLLAERTLGQWPSRGDSLPALHAAPAKPLDRGLVLVNMKGAGQSGVALIAPFVAQDQVPASRVGAVANTVLGGGYSARLNEEVRVKRGLSYGASSATSSHQIGGTLLAKTQTNNPTAAQVVELMRAEIKGLVSRPTDAGELAARKAALVGDFARSLESTAGLAAVVARQIDRGRPLVELNNTVPELLAVSAGQVSDFAAEHWGAATQRTVVVGDLKLAGEALLRLDPQALVIEESQLDLAAPGLVRGK